MLQGGSLTMPYKHALFATGALLAATIGTTAHAQTTGSRTAAASNTIEELVVTAEKREQSLQDVPVAVSAFTSEKRDLIGITTIQDMTNFTPGLQYSSQLDRTSLRGLGRLTNEHTAQGAVAVYSDGIYTSSTVEAGKPPIFSDRVEVLRGPQGTLYGRNAIGGSINVISKRPTDDWYAEVRGNVENYNHNTLSGAVSGPTMIPGVTFRLSGSWDKQTEGWIKNIVPGMPSEGNVIDTKILEGQLKFHFNDNFEGWMKLAGYRWDNGAGGPGSRATWTPAAYPTVQYLNQGLTLNPGYACNPGSGATNVVNLSPMGCTNPALTNPREIASTVPYQVSLNDTAIFASEWIYHFDKMDLKYTAGGTHYHYTLTGPQPVDETAPITQFSLPFISASGVIPGAVKVNPTYAFKYEEIENWISHEVNLASTDKGPFQWLVGAYYYHEHFQQPVSTSLLNEPLANGPFVTQTTCFQTSNACAPTTGQQRIYDDRPDFTVDSRAVYGQIDWEFVPHWKTTLGLRYSSDQERGTESVRLLCMDVAACLASPPTAPVGFGPELAGNFLIDLTQIPTLISGYPGFTTSLPAGVSSFTTVDPATGFATRHYDSKWSATTGTAGVQWEPDADTNLYFRYSRGYKAGGLRVGIDTTLGPQPNSNAEHANAYEVGLKKNFGRTLQTNLAVFYYDYSNTQVPITLASTSGGLSQPEGIFYNIPKAISQGVELEAIWQPIENLQLLLNYSYLDAHITESGAVIDPVDPTAVASGARPIGPLTPCVQVSPATTPATFTGSCDVFTGFNQRGQDLSGNHLPNAPKNKVAFNANYTWRFSPGSLIGSVSYTWRDAQYGSIFDRSYYRSPSYSQVDARLTWKSADNKYSVILYGRNIFDTLGYEGGAGAYRQAGFVPGYATGTTASPFVVPVVQGIASTYPITPPRTYGIELQYRFF
jgi:iron complex outermembrane receptor protein